MTDIPEMALEILQQYPKGLHVDDIALHILEKYQNLQIGADELSRKISTKLAYEFKTKGTKSRFSKIKNKNGSHKKGIYKEKRRRKQNIQAVVIENIKSPSTNFTGSAGEYAVLSELLFRGYNSAIMTVDEGIDLVASKNNRYYHIQVKTATESASGFNFGIKQHIFQNNDEAQTFYVLLCRRFMNSHFQHDFIILSSSVVSSFVKTGVIKDKATLSMRISIEDGKFMLNKLIEVSPYVNQFELIK